MSAGLFFLTWDGWVGGSGWSVWMGGAKEWESPTKFLLLELDSDELGVVEEGGTCLQKWQNKMMCEIT